MLTFLSQDTPSGPDAVVEDLGLTSEESEQLCEWYHAFKDSCGTDFDDLQTGCVL